MAQKLGDKIKAKPGSYASKRAAGGTMPQATNVAHGSSFTEGSKAVLALDAAYRENYHQLLAYARSRVGSQAAAQDVVQQAFLNTMGAIDRGAKINYMPGFLQRCVGNLCISNARLYQPESIEGQLHRIPQAGESAEGSAEMHEQLHDIDLVLNEMPYNQRYAFLQAELRGFKQEEIAKEMNRSVGSVRQLVRRARRTVRMRVAPGRVAGWWWPFNRLRRKEKSEKRRGSFSIAAAQLATANAWLARVSTAGAHITTRSSWATRISQASAKTLLQPQAPIALAAVVFVLAGISIAPQASDNAPPAGVSSTGQTGHATSGSTGSKKYLAAGFPDRAGGSDKAASAGDSAGYESSNGPYASSKAPLNAAGNDGSKGSVEAESGDTVTTPLDVGITDPAEPPATNPDPQAPVTSPGQTAPPDTGTCKPDPTAGTDDRATPSPDPGDCTRDPGAGTDDSATSPGTDIDDGSTTPPDPSAGTDDGSTTPPDPSASTDDGSATSSDPGATAGGSG